MGRESQLLDSRDFSGFEICRQWKSFITDALWCWLSANDSVDCVNYQKEKKTLESLRLDLDAAKTKLRRAKSQPGKETVSISPVVIGYVDIVVTSDDDQIWLLLWFEFQPNFFSHLTSLLMCWHMAVVIMWRFDS